MSVIYAPELFDLWTESGDLVSVYRQDKRDKSADASSGLRAVSGAQSILCKKHDTDNYDEFRGVGQVKQNNIMTSDKISAPLGLDIRADDVIEVVASDGRSEWFTVAGAPKTRPLIPHMKVYLTPAEAPTIVAGSWSA